MAGDAIAAYIRETTGLFVAVVVTRDTADLLRQFHGTTSSAFGVLRAFQYVQAREETGGGIECVLVGLRAGYSYYFSSFYALRKYGYSSILDLNGKVWIYSTEQSESGYRYPVVALSFQGVVPGASVVTGGSEATAIVALLQGQGDFCTGYGAPPLAPQCLRDQGVLWEWGDDPELMVWERYGGLLVEEGRRWWCYDLRYAVMREYPNVFEEVGIVDVAGPIPNDCVAFGTDFPADLRDRVVSALVEHISTPEGLAIWASAGFYGLTGLAPIVDSFYDVVRDVRQREPVRTLCDLVCPSDVTVTTDFGQCSASNVRLGMPSFGDCGVGSATNNAPVSFPVGKTTVTWTVTDIRGNTATCTQTVTVIDDEDPEIDCPGDIDAECDFGACAAKVDFEVEATDNCSEKCGPPRVDYKVAGVEITSPHDFRVGTTTVDVAATDCYGNSATCSFDVTVEDDEDPEIDCPEEAELSTDTGKCTASKSRLKAPDATDNCGVKSIANDAPQDLPLGDTDVTWTATDIHGNTAECTQTVTVVDNEAPRFTKCPSNVTVDADPTSCRANVTFEAVATDNCPKECGPVAIGYSDGLQAIWSPWAFPVGVTKVTVTAVDCHKNVATCTFTVTVRDKEPPTITCPVNVQVGTDPGKCFATKVNLGTPVTADQCSGVKSVTNNAPFAFNPGTTTVTWTVTDKAGNTNTCQQRVTVSDTDDPVVPATLEDTAIGADSGRCIATMSRLAADVLQRATDNCSSSSDGTLKATAVPATLQAGEKKLVSWTVTDAAGNVSLPCTRWVTVVDRESPSITCPDPVTANNDPGVCSATNVPLNTPAAWDNCGVASVQSNAPKVFPLGTTTVTWTATDVHGNWTTCTQLVTIVDKEPPKIACNGAMAANNEPGKCSAVVKLVAPTATDNCGIASVTSNAPDPFPVGTTTVTWTATDANKNTATCQQTVTVADVEKPTIICPPAVTVGTDPGQCSASSVQLGKASATDNCAVTSLTSDAPAVFPLGQTTVTWTATDAAGNAATCAQIITVVDKEKPVIACPSPVRVRTDPGKCGASRVVLAQPTATDNCDVPLVTNDAPAVFPLGPTTVTWTTTDAAGNAATCAQIVTVVDEEPPTLACPLAVTVGPDPGKCEASRVTLGKPAADDNCRVASVTNDAPGVFPVGSTIVTWTATDASGNRATCEQVVTVVDREPPTIVCLGAVIAGRCAKNDVWLGMALARDNCGVASVVNDAPRIFPVGRTVVTWTATDVNGNNSTCTQVVDVLDADLPTIACPPAVTVETDPGQCSASGVKLDVPTAAGTCAVAAVTNDAPAVFPVGTTTVTWTATDGAGKTATCKQDVTVVDREAPTLVPPAALTVTTDPGACTASDVELETPVATDNCRIASVTNDAPAAFPVGTTTVTWTATDIHGNASTCAQTVTVVDREPPTVTPPRSVTISTDPGSCLATRVELGSPTVADNCGSVSLDNDAPAAFPTGITIVMWTAADTNGNRAACEQTVTVVDAEIPRIGCPSVVTARCDPGAPMASVVLAATATDNCGIQEVAYRIGKTLISSPHAFPVGETAVEAIATDVHGNSSSCSLTVVVTDDEPPAIACPEAVIVAADPGSDFATGVALGTPAASDNCELREVTSDAPSVFPIGSTTITWTAKDIYGNTASCTQLVTVVERSAPATKTNIGTEAVNACAETSPGNPRVLLWVSPLSLYVEQGSAASIAPALEGYVTVVSASGQLGDYVVYLPIILPPTEGAETQRLDEFAICYRTRGARDAVTSVQVGYIGSAGAFVELTKVRGGFASPEWNCFSMSLNEARALGPLLVRLAVRLGDGGAVDFGNAVVTYVAGSG